MFKRMGHVALQVKDLKKSMDFYARILGLKTQWSGDSDWANLSVGADDLSLVKAEGARHPPHIGFRVDHREDLDSIRARLEKEGLHPEPIAVHRDATVSFYFRDPDGQVLEALWDPRVL